MPREAALKKLVLVVHDTDSKKTSPEAIANNKRLNEEIGAEITGDGTALSLMDPDLEGVAGIDGGKRDKDSRARQFLAGLKSWDEVPDRLRELMETIEQMFPSAIAASSEPSQESPTPPDE